MTGSRFNGSRFSGWKKNEKQTYKYRPGAKTAEPLNREPFYLNPEP
jgi:hypothetical protein